MRFSDVFLFSFLLSFSFDSIRLFDVSFALFLFFFFCGLAASLFANAMNEKPFTICTRQRKKIIWTLSWIAMPLIYNFTIEQMKLFISLFLFVRSQSKSKKMHNFCTYGFIRIRIRMAKNEFEPSREKKTYVKSVNNTPLYSIIWEISKTL